MKGVLCTSVPATRLLSCDRILKKVVSNMPRASAADEGRRGSVSVGEGPRHHSQPWPRDPHQPSPPLADSWKGIAGRLHVFAWRGSDTQDVTGVWHKAVEHHQAVPSQKKQSLLRNISTQLAQLLHSTIVYASNTMTKPDPGAPNRTSVNRATPLT